MLFNFALVAILQVAIPLLELPYDGAAATYEPSTLDIHNAVTLMHLISWLQLCTMQIESELMPE